MTRGHKAMGAHQSARPISTIWLTPPPVLAALGGAESFDLDPCAAPAPRPWPTAREHYVEEQDGLSLPWEGRVWMNPPYTSADIRRWMNRLVDHGDGIALIFARTETDTFFRCVWEAADAMLFLEGRLHFHVHQDTWFERKGKPPVFVARGEATPTNSGAPSVLIAYGRDNADCLAGCGLAGAFVPLRLRTFVHGLEGATTAATWAEEVAAVMAGLGDRATLDDLYKAFAGHPKAARNAHYQAKIRQTLKRAPGFRRTGPAQYERLL